MKYVSCKSMAQYFDRYIAEYHREFNRFVTPRPEGAGYPKIICSPYLYAKEFNIYIARDGVVVFVYKRSVPVEFLKKGPKMNLRRIAKDSERDLLSGVLPKPVCEFNCEINNGTKLKIRQFNIHLNRLVQILTVGNINIFLTSKGDFWVPYIIINFEFTSEFSQKSYDYIEIYPHVGKSAWDIRSIWAKVHLDLRRDFLNSILNDNKEAGIMMLDLKDARIYDRLVIFENAIKNFEGLLNEETDEDEIVFHNFLKDNPVLLDFYGIPISKPRFYYPKGESPYGKKFVEPDFIIRYPDNTYKLVELERPSKPLDTIKGHPRSEVTQAAFQISEWEEYIDKHYNLIKDEYPGINNYSGMVVISRLNKNKNIINKQYTSEIFTYDDLLERAKIAYTQLTNLQLFEKGV